MSPPELFEDVALHLLADLQRHQREGDPMHHITYIDRDGSYVQADRWLPEDPLSAALIVGHLASVGVGFHRPDSETIVLTSEGSYGTARPGDFVGRRGGVWTVISGDVVDALLAEARRGATR